MVSAPSLTILLLIVVGILYYKISKFIKIIQKLWFYIQNYKVNIEKRFR